MSEIPDSLVTSLADRYELERKIGEGGMAIVYLAKDLKHRRPVAVKVLRDDFSATLGSDRFLREIEIAAGLTHPHILALHDSGEVAGLLYYVMPFIAGESLRGRLNREGTLPVPTALTITREVADALSYAHREGVIHRDIKPENVLFSEGHAVVADFGIAKAISRAGGDNVTVTGYPVGTPGYMSPEQAAGITELNERTDIYSLACVVYEMLVGEIPRLWAGDDAVRIGRFVNATPEHRGRLDRMPGRLEQVLVRALAVAVDARHTTPLEFADALLDASKDSAKTGDPQVGDMGHTADSERDFSDSEVQETIGYAAELEARHSKGQGALSIGAVEQVGAEVGIEPDRVRQAARELETHSDAESLQPRTPESGQSKRSRKLEIDRVIDNDMSRLDYSRLIEELDAVLGVVGHVSTLGRSLVCDIRFPGDVRRNVQVTVTPQGGRTRVHVEEQSTLAGGAMLAPFFGGAGGAALGALLAAGFGMTVGSLLLVPAALGAVLGANLTARTVFTAIARRRARQLSILADRLASVLKQMTSKGQGPKKRDPTD
jgi:serine/threonine protein kinase